MGCCLQPAALDRKSIINPKEPLLPEDILRPSAASSRLTAKEIQMRIECSNKSEELILNNFNLTYAWVSQRGFYPDAPHKENQDSYSIIPHLGNVKEQPFFAIYDGHGTCGHECSRFARDNLHEILKGMIAVCGSSPAVKEALRQTHLLTNDYLRRNPLIDDSLSGTTAISALFRGRSVFISNVGDSRAIVIYRSPEGKLCCKPLSSDQTPYRKDERERVKRSGARVMSMDQIEGIEPMHENWGSVNASGEMDEGGDPPRVWSPMGKYPGTAFTRSIGDMYAEELGVSAEPEIIEWEISPNDLYIVLASDGVFEFMTNQMVADILDSEIDPLYGCKAVVAQAYGLWLQYEVRTDDITIIAIKLSDMKKSDTASTTTASASTVSTQPPMSPRIDNSKPVRRVMSREKKKNIIQDVTVDSAMDDDDDDDCDFDISTLNFEKSEAEKSLLYGAIKNSFLFQHLNPGQRETVVNVMQRLVVKAGTWVITQGDQGDRLYIIDEGKFEVRVSGVMKGDNDPTGGAVVHVYQPTPSFHPSFGELSL
eukprot:gene526-1002_t